MPRKTPELGLQFVQTSAITEEEIYAHYPKKVMKPRALAAIRIALRKHSPELLLELTKRFALAWKGEEDSPFLPHPSTWYRGEGFNDNPVHWGPRRPTKQPDKPLWARIDELRNAIACHPANATWIKYDRSKVTEAMRLELKSWREKLADLEAEQMRAI